MFQKFVSDILNKILGNFIYGLDEEKIGLSDLLSGKLELTNIHFKQSIIDLIDIPCRLNFGCVGYFKINLPIFYFMKNPINVYIEDVIIVLSTIPSKYFDDKLYKEKYIENKKNYLLSSEYRAIVCSIEGGVIWQMILSLINNINISIKNVHIRIEDFSSNPSNCFAFGINIEEVFLSLPKEGLPFKRDGYYTKKNELVNNTMINMITVKKLGFYMDYLDMKKLINRKYFAQRNNPFVKNLHQYNNTDHEERNNVTKKKGKKKKKKKHIHKLFLKKGKNVKSNEENLNEFQNIIKDIKHNFSTARRNELDIKNMSKINKKIQELNERILGIKRNNDGSYNDNVDSKKDLNTQGSFMGNNSSSGIHRNSDNNKNNSNNNNNISNCLSTSDSCNKYGKKCSLSISNFYNFNFFSKKEEKVHTLIHDLHIDNDVSWIPCITQFANSLENKIIKGKKEELIKKKKKKRKINVYSECKKMNKSKVFNSAYNESKRYNNYQKDYAYGVNPSNNFIYDLKKINPKNDSTSYIKKAVSFLSMNSFTNTVNRKMLNRYDNGVVSKTKDHHLSDGYFTTKEKVSDSDPSYGSYVNKCRKVKNDKKRRKYTHLGNKEDEGGDVFYDVVDDCKKFSDNVQNSFFKNDEKIHLNFISDIEDKRRKKWRKGHKGTNHHSIVNTYEQFVDFKDTKEEKNVEEDRLSKYIKMNEIKEKVRKKKRKKIHSVYLMYEKTYKINKAKLNTFFLFLQLVKNIKHDYIINPNIFEGYGEIYLSLIPTDHGHLPFSRCFSSWGIQKRSEKEFDECLPKLSVFVTLKNIKIIISDKQILNIVKWVNFNFFTFYFWKAGIVSQFEKSKASNEEEIAYINNWVLKLLGTHGSKEEKLDAEKYCEEFENNHSINIINLLRSRAFCKLQEFKKEVELNKKNKVNNQMNSKKNHSSTSDNASSANAINADPMENNNIVMFPDDEDDNNDKGNALKQVANESIHVLKYLMKNQKVYDKIKNSFREKIFTIDICIDICIINSTFLLTVETSNEINARTVHFVKTYAVLMQCIHYHNQISNTHELKNSIDIELYPLTLLLIINNLDNKYIKPEINVLFILTSANRKESYENYHKKFLFNVENFEFLKKYNILKKRKNNLVHIKSREQSDTLNFGNIKQKLKFLVEDNFFYPKRENNIYCNELNDIVSSDPSIYLRYDNQLYTILEKPDHRLFLHNCAYSIFNINGKIINSFVDDYYHFTDKRAVLGKKKKSTFSFKRKEYFLELGAKYCNDILDNYTTHTNVFLDIQLEKTLSFVITKSGKSSEIQGYSLVLNPMKIVSELTPRLVSYEETLDAKKKNIYDSFFVQFDGIKIKRILNWQHAARNYKTYLDDHFIKPYRNLFHSKNKAFSLTKKDAPDKFSFILNRTKNRDHWGNQKEKAEGSKAEGITNDGHDRNYYNKLRSGNKADVYSDAHKGIYNDDCNDVHKDFYNDGYSDGCNEIRSTFYLSSDGNMSEIFNLKIRKKSSFSDCSSYEYNGNEGMELLRRASSCPATKIGKASIMSQIDIDDINRKKGLSYNVKEYKKKKNYKEENNNFFFFNTCANECEEREGQEIVINTDIYKKHKKSWNKRITNANSANYFTHNHNDKIYNNNSNYVLSMSDKTSCTIHLCHIKFNPTYPMFIVKLNEENLYVNVCDYDVEFFFLIFSDVYEHYNMQELMYKKNNILFLKKKIKSISKLNKKYYNNTLIGSSGNRTLFKKGFYRNRSTKKKSTSEMKGNYAEDANSKIKKQKDSSRNEKCSIVEDHGVMKQKKGIKTEGKNKKIYIKKEQLLETHSQEKYSIFCLKEDEKDQVIDFNKNTKKEELLKNKHERHKRKTYVGYMSDANLRRTKELSIREVKNALVQKNDKEDIFPKCRKCNSNTIFGSHAKDNLNLNAIKDKNYVNNLRKNEKKGNEREHCDNVDASLYDDEKSNISNENDEYIIKLNDNPDVLVLSSRKMTALRGSYHSNATSAVSDLVRDHSHERSSKVAKVKKKKRRKNNKQIGRKADRQKVGRTDGQLNRENPHFDEDAAKSRTLISSDDDSWVDLLENYDSNESLDDNEKKKVQNMLVDVESIKKRLSANNNFMITCSLSLSIKKIFVRLWKRKSPLKKQNKASNLDDLNISNSFQFIDKYTYSGRENRKNTTKKHNSSTHLNINNQQDDYKIGEEQDGYNFTSLLREDDMNLFQNKERNNITQEENEDEFLLNKNFITLNENLQKNMFNNMQYAVPLYTIIFSDICFVAKVEKNNCAYVLYSMNNVDIRDETNITLLSMSSIYHGDPKCSDKSVYFTCKKLMDVEKEQVINYEERKTKDSTIIKNEYNNNTLETDDTYLDYSISNIDLPDLNKTHFVLLYFGYLFKNNHTFKFILNRTKVKIFWEIIDELMSWIVNINELLPKIHTVELDTITKLNNSENKHLDYYLQKIQYINYDNVYFKQNDLLSALSLKRVYKIPITSFMNYYALEFQKEIADNQIESNECNTRECVKIENSGIYNKYIIDYTDMYDDSSDDVCIITDDTLVCNNLKNVILVDTNINVNRTIKEILFYENYFFNYSFNKINKKIDIEKIITGDNTKDTIYYKDKKTIHKKEKKYLNNSAKSFPASLHSATTSHVTNNELIKKKNHLEHFLVDTERQVSFDHLTDDLNCQYCCHLKNLHYTAYTKEICRAYAYPYIHVDVEINYFEFWISLDPIRIPQKRNTYLMSDARSNNMYYSRGKRSKRIRRNRKNLEQKWKKKSNSISSRSLRSTKGRHMKESASFSYYEKVQDGAGIENWEHVKNVEHREGGMDSKDGGEASSRKKTKFHEKIRHYKNMNIEKPYVLATKGCIKSVIFFLLYNDQKSDKREELSDEDCRKEDEHNINTSKLKRHVVSTKLINLNKKNEHVEELKNKVTEMMNYSNLSNVLNAQDFFKINISIFLSQITSAIAKPVATNPFLKAYIDWNNVPYNNILLQPCRGKLNFEMKIPSSEILVERFLGINKITSLKFFKKNNLLYKNVVEGIDLNFYFEPVVVNIDSSTLTLLYQLYNIILDFCNYSMKFYSTKSKEDEEERMYRVNVHDDTYYDNWAEFIINDSFYLNVYDANSCIDSCEYSAYINDELISDNTDLDRELNSYKYNEKNKLFANFFLKPPNNMHSKGLNEEKLSHGEFNKDILNTEQNEKKEIEMREENIVQNGGEINTVVHSEEQPMFTYESEKSVEGQNERYVSSDSHEKNKYHNNYVLDSNILNILMMNFVENVKINCTVNFDVLTFQIWDSNTAYNRCSLNFVIEYIYINFYTLSIYEKNVNCKNNELFNVNDNSSAFQKSISFNRKNNGVSKFSNVPMGSNGEDAPHENNKSFFLKRKYPSYLPNESSKMYSFNNNVDEMLNSSVSNVVYYDDTTTKKDGKKSINKYIYSKSAVEFIRNTDAENLSKKCNMSMMGDTMTDHMNNVNNNMDGIQEICNDMYDGRLPIFNSSNNNNCPDTNMFKYETLNMLKKERLKEKEDNKGLRKLFNWKNFFKNIEQFKIEIVNILKRIFFRKKVKEELEVKEGEAKEKGKKITKKKYENCNDIFMKNNFMFNDIKNYNENKVNKNIECKVEFLIYCENFNKKENSYQTFIEPMCTEIIAVKKDLNSPIHIYYYFSWLNINFNFNFLDNILSLCCSVIFSMITQRTRLLLGRHMYDVDRRKNHKIIMQSGRNEKLDDVSSRYPHTHHTNNNTIYHTEYDDNNTERKNVSEMDDTHTSMYFPNYYASMNEEQYRDLAIITNENVLFRYNKFDVLNSVNRSLDTYIFGEFILEKLLRNYQYSCQYPGDYLAKSENEYNLDKSQSPSEQLLHIKLFNFIKKNKRLEMNNICKINNLLGQPVAICTVHEKNPTPNVDIFTMCLQYNSKASKHAYDKKKQSVSPSPTKRFSKGDVLGNDSDAGDNSARNSRNSEGEKKKKEREKEKKKIPQSEIEYHDFYDLSDNENDKRKSTRQSRVIQNEKNAKNCYYNSSYYTDSSENKKKQPFKYQWKIISNNESLDLPTYENGKVKFFLIRFRLLNYIYDIPSSILNTESDNEDVIRIVIPERRLPPNINKQVEQDLYNDELLEIENKASSHNTYHTIYPTNYTSRRYNTSKDDTWKASNIPQPRNHLFIFFRTSSRISHEEKQEYDFFISSIVAVKNNTDFPLYIFKSVPGNSNKRSIFREYYHKYNMMPSPPPTYTLKIDKKLEKFIERKINTNNPLKHKGRKMNKDQDELNAGIAGGKKKRLHKYAHVGNNNSNIYADNYGDNYVNNNGNNDGSNYGTNNNNYNSSHVNCDAYTKANYTQSKSYVYGRKFINNIFPLMKMSSIEHYISGDIKFSSLATVKYKKKRKGKKRLKHELQKKLIKKKIKEIYIKSIWKKTKRKKISKYENTVPYDDKCRKILTSRNAYRNIMSINDSFFSFAKKSSSSSKKLSSEFAHIISDLSNITLSSLSSSLFSLDTSQSNSSVYDNSLYDYDMDNCEEQALLNEYFNKHSENKGNLDIIEISNNSNKLIPIPLYWLVAENSFIWLSIQNEKIYNCDLYDFLCREKNADYICTKSTLDNILNYQSPFVADSLKLFKPYLIRLKNLLLKENKMAQKRNNNKNNQNSQNSQNSQISKNGQNSQNGQNNKNGQHGQNRKNEQSNRNRQNLLNSYNMNYMNLKEVYFTSTIISVYNPNYVLHKKDAHNFYQINIEHALMINNALPKTMYLNYEIFKDKSKKDSHRSVSTYGSFHFTDKSNTYETTLNTGQSYSLESSCSCSSYDEDESTYRRYDTTSKDKEENNKSNYQGGRKEQHKMQSYDRTDKLRKMQSEQEDIRLKGSTNMEENAGNEFDKKEHVPIEQSNKVNRKNEKRITMLVDKLSTNTWKGMNKFNRMSGTTIGKDYNKSESKMMASNMTSDKQLLIRELNTNRNVFIYKNIKKNEKDTNKENMKSKTYVEEVNFTVMIKKETNKNIYVIRINPGQSIKLPFVPSNVNISFDGYYSKNISINYPHKKGREKIILEKEVKEEMSSFFTLDYNERDDRTSKNNEHTNSTYGKNCSDYTDADRINNTVEGADRKEQRDYRNNEYSKPITLVNRIIKDKGNYENVKNVPWKNEDKVVRKYAKYKSSNYEQFQNQLTIWAIFNEFYETGKNRYQDISLEKVHHGSYAVSCTFFVSACVINRLNYPIKIKRLNNDNTVVVEPYVRKLLPCEFAQRRNKLIISYETLKEIKNWVNYPLKNCMIKRKKLSKTRNKINKKNNKMGLRNRKNFDKAPNSQNELKTSKEEGQGMGKMKQIKPNSKNEKNGHNSETLEGKDKILDSNDKAQDASNEILEGNDKKVSRKFNLLSRLRNGKKTRCFFYRNNINKPLESEDFRITDLSTTRLVCSNKNKNIPQLKYSIYMSIAPMPFFRTTVMEILPYIVIINNTKMNIVFQEFIKNYTYFKYNSLEPGAYVEFHPQSKKKVMLKICGIFQNSFNFLIDDYLEKELYLENLERENEKVLDGLKQHDPASKNCTSMKADNANKGNNVNSDNNSNNDNNTSNNNVSNNNVSNNNDNSARVENNDFLNISQKLSALIGMGKSNHINSSKNVHMAEGQNNAHNSNISHDTLNVHSSSNNNSKERRGTSINSSNSVKHSLDIQGSIINGNSFVASNNNVKKYKYIDEFRFLYWSEVLDLTRVSMVYFRHPVISDENFKKEEKKLRKFNLLLKKHRGNDDIYLDMSKELIKGNNIPYEYTCCSMEISTFKGCKFVRFQDIDVVPYYLINLTKYNIKLRQVGIYEHSEVLHKIPKKKKKTFDEIFKNYAFNFSFYNPYKDPKLKVSILISNKKNEKNKKQKKLIRRKKNLKFRYSNSLIENLKNELNYLTFLATNYLTANEDVKVINDKIFRLKKFSEQVENLNDGNVNIMDLGNSNNVTLLKLKDGDTFVFILCTKKTYNGKTIFSFETYDDLISNVLNFSNSSYHHKQSYKLRKSFHHLLSTQMNRVYVKNRSKRKKNSNKSKNMKDLKKKKESQNFWYLINLFKKKSTARPMEKDPRISNIIADLYEKKIINRQEKKKKFTLNLNIFAHFIFKGLGLSINNYNLEEILYFSMEYILIIYKQINDKELFHINVGWLQIDNHTKNTDYKNVLLPIVDLKKKNETYNSFNTHEKMCESTNETFEKFNKNSTFFKQMKYNSNDTFSYFMKDKSNNFSKNNSDNMLNSLHSYKKKSFDSYFENDNLLISTNINNPLCNSYKIFIPSFFYSEYNSILNIVIIKQKRGNMKNFLELSDVSIKISPMSINIDSYFIIEILKIFDELLKIMEFDLSDYNSLNLEKNIELRDNDFDSLEYKKNIGPLEELIKHYILKDYYLYEQIANFKFSSIKDVGKMNDNNLFHSSILYNRNSTDVLDLKAYITMIKEYKTVEQRSTKNTDQLMKDGNHLDTIMLSPLCIENAGKNKHLNFGISNNSLISKQSTKRSPSNDVLVERNDTFFSAHNGSSLCSSKINDERTPQKDQIYKLLTRNKTEEDNIMNSIYNSDVFNEDKMSYLQNCEKYYKHLLNNRKRILKKIQNINLKNSLISFDKLFISKLEINEIKLIINIKNRSLSYDKKSEIMGSNVMNALVVLIMNIPNISDAHLHFEKEVKKNMCGSLHALIFNEVMNDYINPGMNQMFNVLGAIDFIGNPLIIYKRWKKGYHAFIKDLKKSVDSCSFPLLFCILLLNIIGKFGKSLLSGVLEGVSRLCGSWSTCFERFSRNADNYSIVTNTYILQSEILDQPSNCAEGICYGCHSFLNILTISCVNTLYKPFVALKKSKGFRKNEKDKCKIFLSALKVLSYGLFSGLSSLFFGFFNSILSFFTFLFIGTLNQIQTLTMKSVVRPKKMSVIKEYAKFVNYEYPLSFSNHVINEKKKKKELLKKNIVAIILLYTIRDNNPSNIKSFLWVSNKEVGYCQKDKLLWSLYINCIIKVDILLIQVDSGGQVKKHTIFNRSKNDSKRNKSNFNSKSNCNNNNSGNNNVNEKKKHQHVKTKWKFPFLLNPQKYRQFGDFKPSYYIRILYRSLYKVKKRHGGTRIKYFSLNKKGDYNYRLKKILRKNTYEKYFEKEFKKEHLTYHDSDSNSSAGKEQNESNKIEQNMKCTSEKLKRIHTDNRNDKEKDTQHYRNIYDETLRYYSNHQRGKHLEKMQNANDRMFENNDENKRKELKKKHIYQYKTRNLKVNDKSRRVNKLEHEKKNTKKNHVHKKKKYLYISKLVKCESKEVALQAFSLLLSFLLHKSPYYLKTTY
ncbi:conserved Plasmodium protein, unknown function [Plasmodium malariae]|uniref:Chloroquine resistance marker protein n=1 Tax=Plasmodium malariae TaxID=5858 RepID=A0A1A8W4E1_PLAMA|nr:conserved Plasmodium protein, unknown function [Plasmodium malariae]